MKKRLMSVVWALAAFILVLSVWRFFCTPNADPVSLASLTEELNQMIGGHIFWGRLDSFFSQSMIWLVLLVGAVATVMAASNKSSPTIRGTWSAASAALAAAAMAFPFGERAHWHAEYEIELKRLKDRVRTERDVPAVATLLRDLELKMEKKFPREGLKGAVAAKSRADGKK